MIGDADEFDEEEYDEPNQQTVSVLPPPTIDGRCLLIPDDVGSQIDALTTTGHAISGKLVAVNAAGATIEAPTKFHRVLTASLIVVSIRKPRKRRAKK